MEPTFQIRGVTHNGELYLSRTDLLNLLSQATNLDNSMQEILDELSENLKEAPIIYVR